MQNSMLVPYTRWNPWKSHGHIEREREREREQKRDRQLKPDTEKSCIIKKNPRIFRNINSFLSHRSITFRLYPFLLLFFFYFNIASLCIAMRYILLKVKNITMFLKKCKYYNDIATLQILQHCCKIVNIATFIQNCKYSSVLVKSNIATHFCSTANIAQKLQILRRFGKITNITFL